MIASLKSNYPSLFADLQNEQIVVIDTRDLENPERGSGHGHLGVYPGNAFNMFHADAWCNTRVHDKDNQRHGISRSSAEILWSHMARTFTNLPPSLPVVFVFLCKSGNHRSVFSARVAQDLLMLSGYMPTMFCASSEGSWKDRTCRGQCDECLYMAENRTDLVGPRPNSHRIADRMTCTLT